MFAFRVENSGLDLIDEGGLVYVSINQVIQQWEEDENGVKTTTREKVALGYEKCGDSFDFLDQETVSSSPIERPAGRC